MTQDLEIIGRGQPLLQGDLADHEARLGEMVRGGRFLVVGAAGSIGQAVVKEIFRRGPRAVHAVDLSENNLVELVRDLRSSLGYISGDFRTFALDVGTPIFRAFHDAHGPYDYVLNLAALKHVRSERDPFTLLRMLEVNILHTADLLQLAIASGAQRYFSVSTDKAANPANMMGASKRIMEFCLLARRDEITTASARFANVAFSDGSLLHGFERRLAKGQPLSAPRDVQRYFLTDRESGELCLLAGLLANSGEIFFPKPDRDLRLVTFAEIAERFLRSRGLRPHVCESEEEARGRAAELRRRGVWPCHFFDSDTTGEKPFEEFHVGAETLDLDRFRSLGVVTDTPEPETGRLDEYLGELRRLKLLGQWTREELISLTADLVPSFRHLETGKFLDARM